MKFCLITIGGTNGQDLGGSMSLLRDTGNRVTSLPAADSTYRHGCRRLTVQTDQKDFAQPQS